MTLMEINTAVEVDLSSLILPVMFLILSLVAVGVDLLPVMVITVPVISILPMVK